MNKVQVKIITKDDDDENIPKYSTLFAAGADLKANITKNIILSHSKTALVPTGIYLEIPKNFEVQIRPRSGLALNSGITVLNTPGTIDSDYQGEIKVILINHSNEDFIITPKMRIAQMVLSPVYRAEFIKCKKLSLTQSSRGVKGFGHTGTH